MSNDGNAKNGPNYILPGGRIPKGSLGTGNPVSAGTTAGPVRAARGRVRSPLRAGTSGPARARAPVLVALNKPWGVISQFSPHPRWASLGSCVPIGGVYPAGRLDADSEGLLLLTDDGALQAAISGHAAKRGGRGGLLKRYWVLVEGEPSPEALERLRHGIELTDGPTLPAEVRRMEQAPPIAPREPPPKPRTGRGCAWLEIGLREGRNRQVRRMTAAIGHPTLRLVRCAIGALSLERLGLAPGQWRYVAPAALGPGEQRVARPAGGPARLQSKQGPASTPEPASASAPGDATSATRRTPASGRARTRRH